MTGKATLRGWLVGCAAALATAFLLEAAAVAPAFAQNKEQADKEAEEKNRVFTAAVGEKVLKVQEQMNAGNHAGAIDMLNQILAMKNLSAYETGVVYQLRAANNYELDRIPQTIADFEQALAVGDWTSLEKLNFQFNIGQLYLAQGNYREAVKRLEAWIAAGGQATDKVHFNMVAAYSELNDYRAALRHGRAAFEKGNPRERKHYDVLNFLFTELDMPVERAALLQEMVQLFPTDKKIWLSIAALYAQGGQEKKAFEINKIMYVNGMMVEEKEIMQIVDYYSYYEVPYRGARILEREMNRGRVAKTQKNFEKLARLYRQASQFDKAIAPLTEAARLSGNGELFQQLGEAFYSEGKLAEAENALRQAINKGGLKNAGDAWVVMGNARYEREKRQEALDAFREGAKFRNSAETANRWIEFILTELDTAKRWEEFKDGVKRDEVRVRCERWRQSGGELRDVASDVDCVAVLDNEDYSSAGLPNPKDSKAASVSAPPGAPPGTPPAGAPGGAPSEGGEDAGAAGGASAEAPPAAPAGPAPGQP